MRVRSSAETFGLPTRLRDRQRQKARNPARCQRMLVSGLTITTTSRTDGHQDASLRRPLAASTPNRIFGTHNMSQRTLGEVLGTTEQAIAKWEKAREKPVANKAAERLLRLAYINY